jgi:hypothetical protein
MMKCGMCQVVRLLLSLAQSSSCPKKALLHSKSLAHVPSRMFSSTLPACCGGSSGLSYRCLLQTPVLGAV